MKDCKIKAEVDLQVCPRWRCVLDLVPLLKPGAEVFLGMGVAYDIVVFHTGQVLTFARTAQPPSKLA